MFFVSRQSYWPDGELFVEIASGGIDYANPNMLAFKYPGEGQEYLDPREAVEKAIEIKNLWQKDSDEEINLGYGYTGGFTMPFSVSEDDTAIAWAEEKYSKLPKCVECGNILGKTIYSHHYSDDDKFCSEFCAEQNYNDIVGFQSNE